MSGTFLIHKWYGINYIPLVLSPHLAQGHNPAGTACIVTGAQVEYRLRQLIQLGYLEIERDGTI